MQMRSVPVDQGDLKESMRYQMGAASVRVKADKTLNKVGDPELTAYVIAGSKKAFYAQWVEFGTKTMKARPFFYPSWRALRPRIKRRIAVASRAAAKEVARSGGSNS